ncbi:MAG TPA: hypothetical protein VG939_05785 [Caulobacteraceae bacterium]|nr:hypothetical protein [Caulobacteraceae bacterium]
MSGLAPLFTSSAGVRHAWRDDGDGVRTLVSSQDVEAILDRNKAMATHNDGYAPSRELRRVASIPLVLILKWKNEEGWNAFDPACAERLRRKLNDPEYQFLRTAPGRL